MPFSPSLLVPPELPRHCVAELEAYDTQYRQIAGWGFKRLTPEEERLQRMMEEYRVRFEYWFRDYMGRQWDYSLHQAASYFDDRPKDPFKVLPIRPLVIPFRYWNYTPASFVMAEGDSMAGMGLSNMTTAEVQTGNVTVWQEWNTVYYQYMLNGTATATSANTVTNYQTGIAATEVWAQWNQYYQQQTGMMAPPATVVSQQTEEQVRQHNEAIRQQAETARLAAVKREQERMAAKEKAKMLLASALEAEQKASFEKNGYFDVVVKDKTYRIKPGEMIQMIERQRVVCKYCIHPESAHLLPNEDVALSQKLLLESCEETFLRIANRHSV